LALYINKSRPKEKSIRGLTLTHIDKGKPWGFFNGGNQCEPRICAARDILFINNQYYFHVMYATKDGTNNQAKLYALRVLLKLTVEKGITQLQVYGDSKLIVD
jgi:ribonuclease HI